MVNLLTGVCQAKKPLNFVVCSQNVSQTLTTCVPIRGKSPVALPTLLHRYGYQGRREGAQRDNSGDGEGWDAGERNNDTEIYSDIRVVILITKHKK